MIPLRIDLSVFKISGETKLSFLWVDKICSIILWKMGPAKRTPGTAIGESLLFPELPPTPGI